MEQSETIDVNHHDSDFLRHRHERYAELRTRCPVVFNEHYGGFWLVTDYESVTAVARDNETFAHRYDPDNDELSYQGICGIPRPKGTPRQGVSEIDGPEHADLRRVLNPFMTPQRVEAVRPRMEQVSGWFLDEIVESGRADLVHDFTTPVPAVLTLEMMGLPSENWRHYADFFHAGWEHDRQSAEYQAAIGRWQDMMDELLQFADHRRRNPADDLTTTLVHCELAGRPITPTEVGDIMWNLVAGGLDTTTSLVSWALHHLGTNPEDRSRLRRDRSLLPGAIEEFLRFYSPSETLTRTATADTELGGRSIQRGDVVLISWVSANRDPSMFDEPEHIEVQRDVNKHIAFGMGGHRCIGSHVARAEAAVMLADVLDRIPDYELDLGGFRPYPPNALMTGVVSMPATFTPDRRRGVADPFETRDAP